MRSYPSFGPKCATGANDPRVTGQNPRPTRPVECPASCFTSSGREFDSLQTSQHISIESTTYALLFFEASTATPAVCVLFA